MKPVTERSVLELARAVRGRELSARDVVETHIDRHQRLAPRLNALAAERFDAARREADAADALIAASGEDAELPPLLGVPFTVKESIALQGMPLSAGLVARGAYRSRDSAPAVQRLVDAGAIPLGVTNTSELTLWIESVNRLYGRTSNPYDPRRTAGGSSGGEGAAVGSGASPFGVASDIAGSIRIPAFFCGVFGHKPSPGVVPNAGLYPPSSRESERMLQVGALSRRAEDLLPLLRIMSGARDIERSGPPFALGDPEAVSLDGLPVATVEDSSLLPISRELRDARERAVGALAAQGAVLLRISMRSWRRALLAYLTTLQAGSDQSTLELLAAEGAGPQGWAALVRPGGPHTLATRLTLAAERLPQVEGSRRERLLASGRALAEELTEAIGAGVLLHPAHPRVAPRHGRTVGRPWLLTPAAVFNLAGVPVTEVPLGLSAAGLPLGVQVAAGHDRDHVSIAVALALERAFGGWRPPPVTCSG